MIEILATVSIVAVLAVLTTAGLNDALNRARVSQSLSNLSAIGRASLLYAAENNGKLPQSTHQGPQEAWQYVLPAYLGKVDGNLDTKVFSSPIDPARRGRTSSFAINDYVTAHPYGASSLNYSRLQSIEHPSSVMFFSLAAVEHGTTDHFHFADGESGGRSPDAFRWQVLAEADADRGHYLFIDGHVEAIPWPEVQTKLTTPGERFLNPAGT